MEVSAATDFSSGVALDDLPDGHMLAGRIGGEDVLLIRRGESVFAIGAACTHYHGPLADGLLAGETIRCPWHHACFDIRTGAALHAPALDAVSCWRVERRGDWLFVREKLGQPAQPVPDVDETPAAPEVRAAPTAAGRPAAAGRARGTPPGSIVIVGGGAAGLAAALTLRREGYANALQLISADDCAPYDRPNLSKDFLAGNAPDEWMPLRGAEFYKDNGIELLLNARVASLDTGGRRVTLADGRRIGFDALLLATGAEPVRLAIPGAGAEQVCYLRSFADGRSLVAKAVAARRVAVLGASFIGLEVAASLRARGLEVDVIGLEKVPLERVLGEEVGRFVQDLHASHGVRFHLGNSIAQMSGRQLRLNDGTELQADLVVAGVGVRPAVALAAAAGITLDRGVLVDQFLQTSVAGVFAAGDIARWPDAISGGYIRVEHWVVAERQGQTAARNMLGRGEKFVVAPFFWSQHYDMAIHMVGHAESWDSTRTEGTLAARDCTIRYRRGEHTLAVATIGRDRDSLQAELSMESSSSG
jgi:NADPH-dependent 2,4-dienoyl-CoA reductase/sulfur reductase-like enzyme/nitrite reductase/ring-hydroxylating ferredoxin subunit